MRRGRGAAGGPSFWQVGARSVLTRLAGSRSHRSCSLLLELVSLRQAPSELGLGRHSWHGSAWKGRNLNPGLQSQRKQDPGQRLEAARAISALLIKLRSQSVGPLS